MAVLQFIVGSIVWWLGVSAPLLLGMAKLNSGEYLNGTTSCALSLAMIPYGLYLLCHEDGSVPSSQTSFVPPEYE